MREVILTRGLPCSGKTTWAKEVVTAQPDKWARVNRDELRLMLNNYVFNKSNERMVKLLRAAAIQAALTEGKSIIVDETGLNPQVETEIRLIVDTYTKETSNEVIFHIKNFDITIEEALARNKIRNETRDENFKISEDVITGMYHRWIKRAEVLEYREQDKSLPECIICDLDGTLAIHQGRDPYDASKCDTDVPNTPIRDLLLELCPHYDIVFLSGRDEQYLDQTVVWLNKHFGKKFSLYMRPIGDTRKDSIVKRELFEKIIEPHYRVKFVLDDRDQVVKMWRQELKLPCFQVNYGDF